MTLSDVRTSLFALPPGSIKHFMAFSPANSWLRLSRSRRVNELWVRRAENGWFNDNLIFENFNRILALFANSLKSLIRFKNNYSD